MESIKNLRLKYNFRKFLINYVSYHYHIDGFLSTSKHYIQ